MSTLAALREATQAQHRALEAMPLPARVMSATVSLHDYRAFLRAQAAVLAYWVRRAPAAVRHAGGCRPEARLAALHADLADFPGDPRTTLAPMPSGGADASTAALPPARFDWPDASPAWWGAFYVIEGSRLGARVVARHLRAQLHDAVDGRLAYLEFAGDAPWPQAVCALEGGVAPAARDLAAAGANAMFACYAEMFGAGDACARVARASAA